DFTLTAPASIGVLAGTVDNHTVTIGALSGFSGSTVLTVAGLPAGVTAGFAPPTISGSGSSTLTFTVSAGAPPRTHPITVAATSGSLSHTANLNLAVTDFTVLASPATRNVIAGGSVTYSMSASAPYNSPGSAAFAATGMPVGLTAAFNPSSVAFNSS